MNATVTRERTLLIAGIVLVVGGAALIATAAFGLAAARNASAVSPPPATGVAPPAAPAVPEPAIATTAAPSAPASPSAGVSATPAGGATTAFSSDEAMNAVDGMLAFVQEGRRAEARALATSAFAAAGGRLFDGSDLLIDYQVLMAIREDSRWVVYVSEEWRSGPGHTRYPLLEAGGRLLVDGAEVSSAP